MMSQDLPQRDSAILAMLMMSDDLGDGWSAQTGQPEKRIHNCEWDNIHGDIVGF